MNRNEIPMNRCDCCQRLTRVIHPMSAVTSQVAFFDLVTSDFGQDTRPLLICPTCYYPFGRGN